MKKSIALSIVALVFLLAACSWNSLFIVVNDSEQPATVVYKLAYIDPNEQPQTLAASQLKGNSYDWQNLAPEQFQLDRERKTYTVVLAPQQALRLAGLGTYTGHESINSTGQVQIQALSVKGASGEINLTGELAQRAFANEISDNYYFHYK